MWLPTEHTISLVLQPLAGGRERGGASVIFPGHAHFTMPVTSHVCTGRLALTHAYSPEFLQVSEGRPAVLGLTPSGYRRGNRNDT